MDHLEKTARDYRGGTKGGELLLAFGSTEREVYVLSEVLYPPEDEEHKEDHQVATETELHQPYRVFLVAVRDPREKGPEQDDQPNFHCMYGRMGGRMTGIFTRWMTAALKTITTETATGKDATPHQPPARSTNTPQHPALSTIPIDY